MDGRETEIVALDYGYSGVGLEAGVHMIQMVYRPVGLAAGAWISLGGLLASAALFIGQRRRKCRELLISWN